MSRTSSPRFGSAQQGRYHASGIQTEFEAGSRGRVLRNQLGIRRVREMQQAESEALLSVQEWAIEHYDPAHRFTAADLLLLHRRWLGSIYTWAGEYRQVNVSKNGFLFAAALQIPRLMSQFERQELARWTPCEGLSDADLIAALACCHAELVLIHPFREGNGRCARLLALQAGWPPLDFSPMSGRGRPHYFAAIRAAVGRDYTPLQDCFSRVLRRSLRAATRKAAS